MAFTEEKGQYEPAGQRRHATKGSPCAKVPAGQGAREAVGVSVPEGVVVRVGLREGVAEGVADGLQDVVPLGVGDREGVREGVAEHQTPGKSAPAALASGPCPAQRGTITTSPCPPAAPLALLATPLR